MGNEIHENIDKNNKCLKCVYCLDGREKTRIYIRTHYCEFHGVCINCKPEFCNGKDFCLKTLEKGEAKCDECGKIYNYEKKEGIVRSTGLGSYNLPDRLCFPCYEKKNWEKRMEDPLGEGGYEKYMKKKNKKEHIRKLELLKEKVNKLGEKKIKELGLCIE